VEGEESGGEGREGEEREIDEREMIIEKERGGTEEEGIRGEKKSGES
jgi:hypothetical protein